MMSWVAARASSRVTGGTFTRNRPPPARKTRAGSAPRGRIRQRAGNVRVLLGLQLRRQLQERKILRRDIVRDAKTTPNCPLTLARGIPGKADSRHEIVSIRSWFPEFEHSGQSGDGVQGLQLHARRVARPFVAQSEVQGETGCNLPVI